MVGELDAELWSTLPIELMDLVLQRLPISTLCRFRAVCKRWSTLPTLRAKDPYFLCFPFRSLDFVHFHRCRLYSFIRNQWEDLDFSFLASLVAQHCLGKASLYIRLENSCSDGGLLCLHGSISNDRVSYMRKVGKRFLVVCNPLTRTTKFLPSLDSDFTQDYLMHRDPSSGAYKIFTVMVEYRLHLHYYMYDSNLELWKRILTLKRDTVKRKNLLSCSIVFNGVYYSVCGGGEHAYELSAYNMNEDRWLATGVKTELDTNIKRVSFVVHNDCLLLLAKTRWNKTRYYKIDDSEELELSRLDRLKEIKLPMELNWYKAFAYGNFILFLQELGTDFTVVDIADPNEVKTRFVPLFPTGFSSLYPIQGKATFNLQATL